MMKIYEMIKVVCLVIFAGYDEEAFVAHNML